jgi:hypothetical protein
VTHLGARKARTFRVWAGQERPLDNVYDDVISAASYVGNSPL